MNENNNEITNQVPTNNGTIAQAPVQPQGYNENVVVPPVVETPTFTMPQTDPVVQPAPVVNEPAAPVQPVQYAEPAVAAPQPVQMQAPVYDPVQTPVAQVQTPVMQQPVAPVEQVVAQPVQTVNMQQAPVMPANPQVVPNPQEEVVPEASKQSQIIGTVVVLAVVVFFLWLCVKNFFMIG